MFSLCRVTGNFMPDVHTKILGLIIYMIYAVIMTVMFDCMILHAHSLL